MSKKKGSDLVEHQILEFEKAEDRTVKPPDILKPRNNSQAEYIEAIKENPLVFGVGPAGTGKTYIAACLAAEAIRDKRVERVIVTRPVVETGESLGFLPGTMSEKFEPYFAPVKRVFERQLGATFVDLLVKRKRLEIMPLAYMRGHTFDDSFVIFDEAQNASFMQMKMVLTRIGERSRVVINGDPEQIDLRGADGLVDAVQRVGHLRGVKVVKFDVDDVVRSGLTYRILQTYQNKSVQPAERTFSRML